MLIALLDDNQLTPARYADWVAGIAAVNDYNAKLTPPAEPITVVEAENRACLQCIRMRDALCDLDNRPGPTEV